MPPGPGMRPGFTINVANLYVDQQSRIMISPADKKVKIIVSYLDEGVWNYLTTIEALNGVVYFTPELPGRYRFDIKEFNMIIGTTQADAVVFAKPGFAFPLADLLSSEIVEEVYKETKTEQVQVPLEKDKMIYKPTTIFKKDNKIKLEKNLLIHTCVLVLISIGSVIFVLITRKKK